VDLKQLLTFRTAAQELSFTRTAEVLSYAPSSVTGQIQALEEEMGTPLFERRGKRVTLTEPGVRLLAYAEQILRLADEAKQVVSNGHEPAGTLTIGALESLCAYRLTPVLSTLQQRFPKIELVFRPGIYPDIHKAVAQDLDAAFVLDLPIQSPRLIVEQLQQESIFVVASPSHPLAGRECVTPADLEHETLLLTGSDCRYRQLFEQTLTDSGVHAGRKIEFVSVEAIKQCAISGLGIAVLTEISIATELAQHRLQKLNWAGPAIELYTQLVWHKDKWLSPALQAFLEVTRETLQENKKGPAT